MKKNNPLVVCATNSVAQDITANVLLAIGAKPAMVSQLEDAVEITGMAKAVLINIGTVDDRQLETMLAMVDVCKERQIPYVLDPVACHLSKYRFGCVKKIINVLPPTIIRGNHAEIDFLEKEIADLEEHSVILSTGKVDRIHNGITDEERVEGGEEMLQDVTATGCAQGAICAAMLGFGHESAVAVGYASIMMKAAGEMAWKKAKQPGSFRTALIDALYKQRKLIV